LAQTKWFNNLCQLILQKVEQVIQSMLEEKAKQEQGQLLTSHLQVAQRQARAVLKAAAVCAVLLALAAAELLERLGNGYL
jgi:hypothetical protein